MNAPGAGAGKRKIANISKMHEMNNGKASTAMNVNAPKFAPGKAPKKNTTKKHTVKVTKGGRRKTNKRTTRKH
jgi:hypothetical protein